MGKKEIVQRECTRVEYLSFSSHSGVKVAWVTILMSQERRYLSGLDPSIISRFSKLSCAFKLGDPHGPAFKPGDPPWTCL
jgi:hypothetical protein